MYLTYLSFYTLSRLTFFRETSHWECLKYHFKASRYQNFLGDDAPRPHQKTNVYGASFQPPLPPSPSWNCAPPACKDIDLRRMRWNYCKRNMVQVRFCSRFSCFDSQHARFLPHRFPLHVLVPRENREKSGNWGETLTQALPNMTNVYY